jgi:ABC-type transporter MlaC component
MKTQQLKYIIREELKKIIKEEPALKGDTATLINNFKKLDIPGFDAGKLTTTIMLVKQNKTLNPAANKILADVMTAMIKTNDDTLLTKIFSNLKHTPSKYKEKIQRINKNVATCTQPKVENVATLEYNKYSCGCAKSDKKLCPKHQRT